MIYAFTKSVDFSELCQPTTWQYDIWSSYEYFRKDSSCHVLYVLDNAGYRYFVKRVYLTNDTAGRYFSFEAVCRKLEGNCGYQIRIEKGTIYLVMPWYQAMDSQILRLCDECVHGFLVLSTIYRIIALHNDGIMHRELTPEHIVIDDDLGVHFLSFTRATVLAHNQQFSTSNDDSVYDQLIDFSQAIKALCWHFYGTESYKDIEAKLVENPALRVCRLALNLQMDRIYETYIPAELESFKSDLEQASYNPDFEFEPIIAYFERYYALRTTFHPTMLNSEMLSAADRYHAGDLTAELSRVYCGRETAKKHIYTLLYGFEAKDENCMLLECVSFLIQK